MTLGENVRVKRNEYKLTQIELANRVGISRQTVTLIESGYRVPSLGVVEALADTFHCSIDELVGREVC